MSSNARADLVVAVDCSTTASKAVVFDASGAAVATGRSPIAMSRPFPGWHEQHAGNWWSATCQALRSALQHVAPDRVANVTITHQRESFVCLDGTVELRPSVLWMDARAQPQVERLGTERVHEVSGRPPDTTPSMYKLAWLAEHEPATLERATRIGDVSAYLGLRLTGRWVSSSASADGSGLLDMRTLEWSEELCALAGVRREQLPHVVPPGTVVGHVMEAAARETGLPAGTPVVAGAGDGQCAAVGAGTVQPGSIYLNMGTAVVCGTVTPTYTFDRSYRTVASAAGNGYLLEAFLSSGTYLVSWFCEAFGPFTAPGLDLSAEQLLEVAAARIRPGADGLMALPYWNGAQTPHWDSSARGAVIGWTGSHGRAHLYRALLEGITFEVAMQVAGVTAAVTPRPDELLVTGGGSRSALWAQLLADVTDRPLTLCVEPETTALGAGMIGAAAAGLHPDLPTAAASMGRRGRTVEPDPRSATTYAALSEVYRHLYTTLQPTLTAISALSR